VSNGDGVADFVTGSSLISISLFPTRAAAARGFATGIIVLLDHRFALDKGDLSSV
jgi:hypothetical protein